MRDLLQEKDRTREAVSQIVSWCLVIALHQTEGIGKKRQDDVAAKALVIQEAAAKRLARQSREEVIAWLRSKLDRLDLPDGALTFRVPLRRAPKSRREQELRIAGDQAATLTWLIFALAIHRALHFGAQRLVRLHTATLENYRQFSDWELEGADWAFSPAALCPTDLARRIGYCRNARGCPNRGTNRDRLPAADSNAARAGGTCHKGSTVALCYHGTAVGRVEHIAPTVVTEK